MSETPPRAISSDKPDEFEILSFQNWNRLRDLLEVEKQPASLGYAAGDPAPEARQMLESDWAEQLKTIILPDLDELDGRLSEHGGHLAEEYRQKLQAGRDALTSGGGRSLSKSSYAIPSRCCTSASQLMEELQ